MTLKGFSDGGQIDVRGVTLSESLLEKILNAAPQDGDGNPTFLGAQFGAAVFISDVHFDRATFKDRAHFEGATFKGDARFGKAMFIGGASFESAIFEKNAWFDSATFNRGVSFGQTRFMGYASFGMGKFENGAFFNETVFESRAIFPKTEFKGNSRDSDAWFGFATFKSTVAFGSAKFENIAAFLLATFEDGADFEHVTFKSRALFGRAAFIGDVRFASASSRSDICFDHATFKDNGPALGLLVASALSLDGTQFTSPIRIQADTNTLTCREGRFSGGVRFDVRRALVCLDGSDLSVPSLLTGAAETAKLPKLLSLRRANVAGLAIGNIDLTECRFAGAHNLDKLRLEADTLFGLSPATVSWERRQVIAEESDWRASRALPGRWIAPQGWPWPESMISTSDGPLWPKSVGLPEVLSPGVIAGLYRALRKGREDVKDDPGAADFYYGEMEMRRHDRGTAVASGGGSRGLAIRLILFAYWLVSGYGLRAWRSLTALAIITALFGMALYFVGFIRPPEPASYWTSLLFAFRSTISLTDNEVKLTAWGSLFQALLRLTGPLLLGLTLLALRGRVKR